ncbi:MAG: hypothetical protein Q9181_006430 [Wetmoreana brouardii]
MYFHSPHVDFLKDLGNYLPLGVLNLPSGPLEGYGELWEESYPNLVSSGTPAVYENTRKSVWPLLCLGWLRTFCRKHPLDHGQTQVRIFILPADVGGRYIERSTRDWEHVRKLMKYVDMSTEAWEGTKDPNLVDDPKSADHDSLFYIFNTLPSPAPSTSDVSCPFSYHAITSLLDGTEKIDGLQTDLYAYQRRSAAMMVRREAEPIRVLDPRLEEIKCPAGGKSFYDRTTGIIYRHPRYYEEAKGGILAETMGLGKTLISLAAILATKGHWPHIPPEYSLEQYQTRPEVGSLMQMAATAASRERIPWRTYLHSMSSTGNDFGNWRKALEESMPSYTIPAPETRRSRRPSTAQPGKLIRLCTATLIITPPNLFSHWRNEITAHVEEGSLKILYLDSKETLTPPVNDLLLYDVILMPKNRFEEEMAAETEHCHCPSSRPHHSPLEHLHFLRIIVDEGHDFSSFGRKNNAVFALQKLHVDRRWIISGTPSSGLLGVEANTAIQETLGGVGGDDGHLVRDILESRRRSSLDSKLAPSVRKSALLEERKDLEKLGSIVVDFLNAKPWSNTKGGDDAASWRQYIIPTEDGGRKPKSLASVLESVVIRHRIEDIEKDVKLPPLYNKTVYLEPKWHDKLSLNLFTMTLAVNAVTAERVDQDYMFHPKNRGSLNQLITNLRCAGFYWTGFTKDELLKSIDVSRRYLESKSVAGQSENDCGNLRLGDFDFLRRAIQIGQTVLNCPAWNAFSAAHELGLYVEDFPQAARKSWSLIEDSSSASKNGPMSPLIVGAPQMFKAQQYIGAHLYEPDPTIGLGQLGKRTMDKLWQDVHSTQERTTKNGGNPNIPESPYERQRVLISTSTQKPVTMGKRTMSQRKQNTSPQKAASRGLSKLNVQDLIQRVKGSEQTSKSPTLPSAIKSYFNSQPSPSIDPSSRLAKTCLSGTASAKLSYLIDRVTVLHTSEKILIFYEGDNIAFYIAQTLELLNIQFLIYTGSLSAARKSAYINTFNTTETFRVLLMDAHQAAHGLHIAAASRVFFVNPVWQPTVEAQAIKRAHRIGQRRPVYVETLVLKGTLEERMWRRRKVMSAQEHHKAEKSLLDDDVMAKLILEESFLPLGEEEMRGEVRKQMAPLEHPQRIFGINASEEIVGGFGDPDKDLVFLDAAQKRKDVPVSIVDSSSSVPKKKKVGFAI